MLTELLASKLTQQLPKPWPNPLFPHRPTSSHLSLDDTRIIPPPINICHLPFKKTVFSHCCRSFLQSPLYVPSPLHSHQSTPLTHSSLLKPILFLLPIIVLRVCMAKKR
ncbi:hypothetical protein PHAVU_004G020600 [Phaseolus vulgaris]|uniref:Uncharacterized protein n=1 Tax=Phaseolus vulgaris TaxID=3885 RepID=V7C2K3_PHAVU|nr:hypothetical protein PHAVU_004G020600g [Phaseolus vulgaris]ESW23126.1 hypothetical protein PHAVU_004G020600g [Phaseolus vulgaris]